MESERHLSDITLSIEEQTKCSANECIIDSNAQRLHCHKCKRKVHYRCTLLPLYQLQQFLNFGSSYRKYICVNCVEMQENIRGIVPLSPHYDAIQLELEKQNKTIATYELELKQLKEEMKKYVNEDVENPAKKT